MTTSCIVHVIDVFLTRLFGNHVCRFHSLMVQRQTLQLAHFKPQHVALFCNPTLLNEKRECDFCSTLAWLNKKCFPSCLTHLLNTYVLFLSFCQFSRLQNVRQHSHFCFGLFLFLLILFCKATKSLIFKNWLFFLAGSPFPFCHTDIGEALCPLFLTADHWGVF